MTITTNLSTTVEATVVLDADQVSAIIMEEIASSPLKYNLPPSLLDKARIGVEFDCGFDCLRGVTIDIRKTTYE